jgi:hypothetical protein
MIGIVLHGRHRPYLTSGLALLILAFSEPFLCAQVTLDIHPTFQQNGIQITGYTSPDFEAVLKRVIGEGPAAATANLHPYTLLVKSSMPTPLFKVVIRYATKNVDGRIVEEGTVINTVNGTRPGENLVLTPDSSLTANLNAYGRLVINQTVNSPPGAPVGPNFDRRFFQHATVVPDLVILANGGVVGPNVARVLEFVKADLQSELDMLALFDDQSKSDEQVFGVLKQLAAWTPKDYLDWRENLSNGNRKARAKGLLQRITLNGETRDRMAQFLRQVVADRKPSASMLHRLD